MKKRIHFLQACFFFVFCLLLGKLAYEQLYHCALLTGTLSPNSAFLFWMQQLFTSF